MAASCSKPNQTDLEIRRQLDALASSAGYWDFRWGAKRDGLHGVTQYPAMMVPAMQSKLLDVLCEVLGDGITMVDPFVGSGTTLVEAMRRGIDFCGQDFNPLAVLISRSKIGPFNIAKLQAAITSVHAAALKDRRKAIDIDFPGQRKWFSERAARELARLRRAIIEQKPQWVRRMLWVILAETVRLTSNSRTSTFKLHIRSEEELADRKVDVLTEFQGIAREAVERTKQEVSKLSAARTLKRGRYQRVAKVELGDSSRALPGERKFDLLVTSPPYGDGVSTVPYGQYSYLPLQWIDKADVASNFDDKFLASTHEIDSRALGGCRHGALERAEDVVSQSPALQDYLTALENEPRDRAVRVAAFFADVVPMLDTVCKRMQPGGYMVWTVGNRRVGGISQPLDQILTELLEYRGCVLVAKLERAIPSKRMACRNAISQTMRKEQVLLLRAGGH